jgi:hypothetical protein
MWRDRLSLGNALIPPALFPAPEKHHGSRRKARGTETAMNRDGWQA